MRFVILIFGVLIFFSACSFNDFFSTKEDGQSESLIPDADIRVNTHTVEPLDQ